MPRHKDAPQVYEVMPSSKRDASSITEASCLWDDPAAWTVENLKRVKKRFIDDPLLGDRSFWEKAADQLHGLLAGCYRLCADAFVVYSQPSMSMKSETKWGLVERGKTLRP